MSTDVHASVLEPGHNLNLCVCNQKVEEIVRAYCVPKWSLCLLVQNRVQNFEYIT